MQYLHLLSANPTKWSNKLKQRLLPTNCLSVFDHFVGLAFKVLSLSQMSFSRFRSSRLEVSRKKDVLKILVKFTNKTPVSATLKKNDSDTGIFLWTSRNFKEHQFCGTSTKGFFWTLQVINCYNEVYDNGYTSFHRGNTKTLECTTHYLICPVWRCMFLKNSFYLLTTFPKTKGTHI